MKRRVAIVGGGLAGIAAAVRLADAGCQPIIIETRKKLGGRATSFVDPRSGDVLDNCQHVLMGCCTNLMDLYQRLDVLDHIEWHERFFWTAAGGEICEMSAARLPAPLHLMPALRRLTFLSKTDRADISRAMRRLLRVGRRGRLAWQNRTFADFLADCDQGESAIRLFWHPIIVSACNMGVHEVGAAVAMHVMQDGFLGHRWGYTMGLPRVPLWSLYDPAADYIADHDGQIRLGCSARAIAYDGARVTGVVTSEGMVEAAAVIAAVPYDRLDKLITSTMRTADARLQQLDAFEVSPIVGVHLWFDHDVLDVPHLVLAGFDTHWLFVKGHNAQGHQHVHAVISAARDWMDLDEAEIVARVVADIHAALPGARGLEPVAVRAVKERRTTFAPVPGVDRVRPSSGPGTVGLRGGGIRNLFLAGDWCDTGWPATMEGAVRSGYSAAASFTGEGGVLPDLPTGTLARVLGLR